MKTPLNSRARALVKVALLALIPPALAAAEGWMPLWNAKDLTEWTTWLRQPDRSSDVPDMERLADGRYRDPIGAERDPLQVFTVVNVDGEPAIRISGEVFGELRSRVSLGNYHLRFEFKWGERKWPPREKPETPRDSGLLYHVHAAPGAEGRVWARSIELQIQEGDVGDLYAVGAMIQVRSRLRQGTGTAGVPAIFDYDPKGLWYPFAQLPGMPGRCVKQPDNERPTGEWNVVELVCLGEESLHIVNGELVMWLHGPRRVDTPVPAAVTSGPIIFQSEGAEVFYRRIEARPITAIPEEFALTAR